MKISAYDNLRKHSRELERVFMKDKARRSVEEFLAAVDTYALTIRDSE